MAISLLSCLAFFVSVNLYNILVTHKRGGTVKSYAEVEHPSSPKVALAAIGTFAYFLEVSAYLFLVFTGRSHLLYIPPFYFQLPFPICIQVLGFAFTLFGYYISLWSVIVRGKYAVSWKMPENHKLVTCGPYRYVRHPSYLGYFSMFFGLLFLWSNLFTLIPLLAIPGYYSVALEEEKLLIRRFGTEYLEYQKNTGKFIPKL